MGITTSDDNAPSLKTRRLQRIVGASEMNKEKEDMEKKMEWAIQFLRMVV